MKDWNNVIADETLLMNTHYTAGRDGSSIRFIVLHHNGGNLSIQQCWNTWQTREASAHYQVDVNGRIGQLVNDVDTAWHAGDWNANIQSIGIEHADSVGAPNWAISAATLDNGAHLVAALCKYYRLGAPRWGINVFGHSHFYSTACPASIAGSQNNEYMSRAQQWYKAMTQGGSVPAASTQTPKAIATNLRPIGDVHVFYGLHQLGAGWLGEVKDFNNSNDNGFAGNPNHEHDLLYVRVDKGSIRYQVHTVGGSWLPWVYKGDKNDTVNGCAGIIGKPIDAVRLYYTSPGGYTYKQAWYRSQTTKRSGWLNVCCDDGTSVDGYDGFAGMIGEPLDRLQILIGDSKPF